MRRRFIVISLAIVAFAVLAGVLFGCRKQDEGVVKIGAVLVLTGPDARSGQNAKRGIDLAVNEINRVQRTRGKRMGVIFEDDQGEPQKAVSAVRKLIDVDRVSAIIGPMWSTSVLAVAPIVNKERVVLLSPTASAPSITKAGDFVFRNTYSDLLEGVKDAEYAFAELGYRKAGIITVNLDAGVEIADVFCKRFEELGGKVVLRESYEAKTQDFRSLLAKLTGKNVDFVYLMGYAEMGLLLKQAREMGIQAPFVSTIMFEISDVVKTAGSAAEGVTYSYPSYDPNLGGELVAAFSSSFTSMFGHPPDPEAAFAYDAAMILGKVMMESGQNTTAIRDALLRLHDYQGVTGITTFDANGDVIKPIGFKLVRNAKYVWRTFTYEFAR